ncbi:class I adenylate-forming enzyme family protein [Streptomyces gibsoniae]|uniref:Fatty acid--CoA ligase family protein n=1 Tax=Streptomyces gibsoniae TaxID=3075529 RepID=A0ABU2TLR7_9ACTN|nr:fatty acid--CoA ligase family protein [Streptomyces sp. DSM 41699]MDT0461864.1 fatty acid--CoA ligase family protein [Streptomyces sp. DSM 41699]
MTATWTSARGVAVPDRVPARLRRRYVEQGLVPDLDLYSLFRTHAAAHPERPAIIDPEGPLDYAALDRRARRIATALKANGVGVGDVVGVQLPDGRRALATDLALAAIGAVALPYPVGRGRQDSLALLGRARARAVVTTADRDGVPLARTLTALRADLPYLRSVAVFGAAPEGCVALDPWLVGRPEGEPWEPVVVDAETPARILVSSGSEDRPKMVAYSHSAMAGGRGNYASALRLGADPMRCLVLMPLASSYGSLGLVVLIRLGGTLVLLDRFDPAAALRAVTELRPSHVFGVPTMLRRIADAPRVPGEDLSSVRAVVSSAAPLPPETLSATLARFGCPVVNIYGSTDGVNCHRTWTRPAPDTRRAGRPDPAVAEIRVVGPDDRPLPAGEAGEIQARGPMTPRCYLGAPELDAAYRTPDGWVRTGDRGLVDGDGELWVLDRLRHTVIRGGYTISPAEVERHIGAHPAIADVACVPVPDPDLSERLCACVARHHGTEPPTLSELQAFLERERGLERRKLPEHLLTLDRLPLGPTGKVCRSTLAQLAATRVLDSTTGGSTHGR